MNEISQEIFFQNFRSPIKDALFGLATGDALGVPAQYKSRQTIAEDAVIDMTGYGTYNLPPGTWSDDSSLAFCLAKFRKMIILNLLDAAWAFNQLARFKYIYGLVARLPEVFC